MDTFHTVMTSTKMTDFRTQFWGCHKCMVHNIIWSQAERTPRRNNRHAIDVYVHFVIRGGGENRYGLYQQNYNIYQLGLRFVH